MRLAMPAGVGDLARPVWRRGSTLRGVWLALGFPMAWLFCAALGGVPRFTCRRCRCYGLSPPSAWAEPRHATASAYHHLDLGRAPLGIYLLISFAGGGLVRWGCHPSFVGLTFAPRCCRAGAIAHAGDALATALWVLRPARWQLDRG